MSDYEFHTKTCTKCNVEQHLYFFHFDAVRGYYASRCIYCARNANKGREHKNKPDDESEIRTCTKCNEDKSLNEYYFDRYAGKHRKSCKACDIKSHYKHGIKSMYGVDEIWREETLVKQDNKCAICKIPFNDTNFKPHIDHNASNGRARAILCPPCNVLLGMHHEDCETLRAAGFDRHAEYLEHYKKIHQIKLVG